MTAEANARWDRGVTWVVLGIVAPAVLFFGCVGLLRLIGATAYPFELDYGEGIVLEQALLMTGPRAYGDITQYPYLVFHYPPVYHLAVRALAATGLDLLVAGRVVSVAATLGIAALVATGAWILSRPLPRRARLFGAAAAATIILGIPIVGAWGALARVDMLAVALSLAAVLLAAHSAGAPARLYGAVLLSVLAVLTKQTSVTAPLTIVAALLATRPRDGLRAMAAGIGMGLLAFGVLAVLTEGGILRHLLTYNINRFTLQRTVQGILVILGMGGLGLLALSVLAFLHGGKWILGPGWTAPDRRRQIADDPRALLWLMLCVAVPVSGALVFLIGKSGSSVNYGLEWIAWSAIPAGMVMALMGAMLAKAPVSAPKPGALVALLLLPGFVLTMFGQTLEGSDIDRMGRAALLTEIRAAQAPVLSDDMVLLVRAGKPVVWEPAIFAELASFGLWDEQLIIRRIRAREFAFIVTAGWRGQRLFDSRYNPAVADAIAEAYPHVETRGLLIVHFPPR